MTHPADGATANPADGAEDRWRLQSWSARAVIRAWERGDGAPRSIRALAMLSTLLPDRSRRELLDLPLGRRDTLLLRARLDLLGSTLQGSVRCPACGAEQAFALEIDSDLLSQAVPVQAPSEAELRVGELAIRVRAPSGHDALALEGLQPTAAWQSLVRGCVAVSAPDSEVDTDPLLLSPQVFEAVGEEIESLDPLALIPLALSCGECGFDWQPLLEVVEIVWAEVESLARRLLDEAQALAMAYGWSEEQIFAMSGRRRRYYLQNAPAATGEEESQPRHQSWDPYS